MEIRDLDLNTDIVADFLSQQENANPKKNDMQVRFGMEELNSPDLNTLKSDDSLKEDDNQGIKKELNLNPVNSTDLLSVGNKEGSEDKNKNQEQGKEGTEGKGEENKPIEIKPEELDVISKYFSKGMEEGRFVAVNEVDDKGNKTAFVPKTYQDFDDLIQVQVDYKLNEATKNLDEKWYSSKSDAWQAIAQYAEMVQDPTELIPFLQGVRTIQTVEQIDENEIDGAEELVRIRLEQRGDPEEAISSQIEALKTADKLVSTAKAYKPIMVKQEKQMLANQVKERKDYEDRVAQEMNDIRNKAYTEIEKPFFGKHNLKKEEKFIVYNLLAQQDEQTGGFMIYSELDKLYAKRDFETLKQIALLLGKKDSFLQYIGTDIANKTAGSLQRKLQAATESHSASGNDYDEEKIPVVNRNKSTGTVRFGR